MNGPAHLLGLYLPLPEQPSHSIQDSRGGIWIGGQNLLGHQLTRIRVQQNQIGKSSSYIYS